MRVLIMGCGRVGSELSRALGEAGHEVTVIDKNPAAFDKYPPGEHARTIVGLGFDRDVLEEAGIRDADAFIADTSFSRRRTSTACGPTSRFSQPTSIPASSRPREKGAILLRSKPDQDIIIATSGEKSAKLHTKAVPLPDAIVQARKRFGLGIEQLTPMLAQKYGLEQDIVVGRDGLVHVPNKPGLGAAIDFKLIERKKITVLG